MSEFFEDDSTRVPLSPEHQAILGHITHTIINTGLGTKYNRALTILSIKRKELLDRQESSSGVGDELENRFIRAIFGPDPQSSPSEAPFAIEVLNIEADLGNSMRTHFSVVQVDPTYGVLLEGSEVPIGYIYNDGRSAINKRLRDIFTLEDLAQVNDLAIIQILGKFNVALA